MARPESAKRVSRTTVPERAHPLARTVFQLMRETNTTYDELEYKSGVLRSTIKAWRSSNVPGLSTIEATLGVFGWSLVPVPPRSQVPPEIGAQLDALAAQWRGINPTLCNLLATVCRAPLIEASAPQAKPRRRRLREPNPLQTPLFETEGQSA